MATKTPAGHGSVFSHCTLIGLSVQMHTIAVFTVGNKIRSSKFPANDSFLHILFGQGEGEFAADGFTNLQSAKAINIGFMFERIFVVFRVLIHEPNAAFGEFLHQSLCHRFFPSVQFIYCE